MANNRTALELLPDTILLEIAKYLSCSETNNLMMLCVIIFQKAKIFDQELYIEQNKQNFNFKFNNIKLHHLFNSPFFNSRIYAMQKNLQRAGLYILRGEKTPALAIVDQDAGLLLQVIPKISLKKNVIHVETHCGRTLYQLALGTYDHETYEALGNRIEEKYGYQVKVQQFNEQFPNSVKSTKSYRVMFDSLIKKMAADLTIDFVNNCNKMNDVTREALEILEISLAEDVEEQTTGVHFDLRILIDFINAYEEGYNEFKGEDKKWKQRGLYWRCGFGKLESFMSYFVAMALNEKNNFFGVMQGNMKVTRSTTLRNNSDFFDLTLGLSHYTINGWDRSFSVDCPLYALLKNFVELTQKKLDNLSSNCSYQQTLTNRK